MKNEENGEGSLNIPGYYYDKKKNRYFLIDNELKKQLKKEEFTRLINDAKNKNRQTKIEEHKEFVKKKFHQIHGIKEMKKKKKNANTHKSNIKNNENENYMLLNKNYNILNNEGKNLHLINNELTFLKRSVSENQNIYNIIMRIRNYNFMENSILSLPPIFINCNCCEYIHVQNLCELQSNYNSTDQQNEIKSLYNQKASHFLNIKRDDNIDVLLNDFKCFNLSQKLMDGNKRKYKLQLEEFNNELFNVNKKYRKQSICSNKTELVRSNYSSNKKIFPHRFSLQHVKRENIISNGCHSIDEHLLIPKMYGRTYERLNSYNIENIKSKITANRYKANFYYFFNSNNNNGSNYVSLDENSSMNEMNNTNNVSGRQWFTFNNASNDMNYLEPGDYPNIEEENLTVRNLDAITNETRVSKTYKPSESFFYLFSNPQYEDIIFSTTKENNFSFSLGAVDLNKFVQKNKKSPMNDIIHENVYYNTDTKYLCSYSKEQSELLCISPQLLSHFNIFNSEYIAYSSYANTKNEKSLMCLLSIKSFFQCTPKIETYNFISEINYFKLFPSMEDNYYTHKDINYSSTCTNDGYSYHHNNKIDKIFICGSFPSFSFSAIKDSVPYCIWDSKKLKVRDLLSLNEDITAYVDNILNAKQPLTYLTHENNSHKKLILHSKKGKEKGKKEIENEHENERKSSYDYYENDTKKKYDNKNKYYSKDLNNNNNLIHLSKWEASKKRHENFAEKSNYVVHNRLNKSSPKKLSTLNINDKARNYNKHNISHNFHALNSPKYNYNDNKKKGICCESVRKSNNNIFLCCNTEYLYLCDLRCNFLNTISKLKHNEGFVNKIYSLSNNYQYILSKTNNHIGLYDMRCVPYKCNDELKNNLLVTYERFIDNDNLKKHLNDFYVIDNEQYIVSLDTYTNSVYIYDIMNSTHKIINLDGNCEYSKTNILHSYINLSKIPYIYSRDEHNDDYYNYYKKIMNETKATDSKHINHFNPLKSYPKKDLFIGLNVQSILPIFYVKQKYSKHNFISINEGGFICTINI
ncbi:hypothetical protein MKS88_000521 [Plasmodium brasilianum]|uniref:Uncharacterized protein n=1 Tax=Plasmodium brasilianum TaxID=5824 RepID=A0ACB9YG57_PLABR|nr:hypothetical protein MKS88_000521 [Plasmodium brasilianum]